MERRSEGDLYYFAVIKDGIPLFEIDFSVEGLRSESVLLTGFVSAISSFSKEFIRGELKTIDQGEFKLSHVEGELVSAILLSSTISDDLRSKVTKLLHFFEDKYKILLESLNLGSFEFDEFKTNVIQTLSSYLIKKFYVPIIISKDQYNKLDGNYQTIFSQINGILRVDEISSITGFDLDFTIEILTALKSQGLIDFDIIVTEYDIPTLTSSGTNKLFNLPEDQKDIIQNLGDNWSRILKKIDGKTTIKKISELFTLNVTDLCKAITQLNRLKYLTILPNEIKLCLIFQRFYSILLNRVVGIMGNKGRDLMIHSIEKNTNILTNLIVLEYNSISFDKVIIHVEGHGGLNYEDILKFLNQPIMTILNLIKNMHGLKFISNLINQILGELTIDYGEFEINKIAILLK